jgi:hypothetical protein
MIERKPPEAWTWSHDIEPDQIDSLIMPGWRPMRLSNYGKDNQRRFAAVVFKAPGPERSYALDLDTAAIEARLRETGTRPVAVTVNPGRLETALFAGIAKGAGVPTAVQLSRRSR